MSLASGTRLGPYEILGVLGAGGMGEVYRARDTRLGRDVAIKILPSVFTDDPDRRARFEREARLLAALNHPHIGAIYGFEDREGVHALVLELVDGETLHAHLKGQRRGTRPGPTEGLPVGAALVIARQMADALEAAHERGIVHRDLKPANIIVQGPRTSSSGADSASRSRDDVMVKVVDFGLAKVESAEIVRDPGLSPTMTIGGLTEGFVVGTAAYMSPEQARGRIVDKRTDIWAFGCVFFEMLTGHNPFAGDTVSDTIAGILEREPDWRLLPDSTPPPIRRLLQRCLDKDLRRRLHDIADARLDIDDASSMSGKLATLGGDRQILRGSRTPWLVVGVLVLIVLLAAAAVVAWRPGAALSRPPLARATIPLAPSQAIEKGRFTPLALSPDGRLLVYTASIDGGRTKLYLRPIDEVVSHAIPATDGATTPFFSRDGRWLGFYADGALKKVSVAGGVPLTICETPPVSSAHWGENDAIVFATMLSPSGLWLVPANGGDPAPITTPKGEETHGYPQLLPGGREVLFSVRRKNAWHLALLDLKDRTWQVLGNGRIVGEGAQYLSTGHLVYAQSGGLVATPFTPTSRALDQPPVPLLERLETPRFGGAYFAVAAGAGTLVYVPAAAAVADGTLLRVERDGRAAPLVETRAAYESAALAPDGRRVAVTIASGGGSDVWILDLGRTTRTRATAGGSSGFPVWGSDGTRIAFQSTAPGPWNLFWAMVDGGESQAFFNGAASSSWPSAGAALLPGTLPTLSGAGPQFPMSWSPDGSTLAFHERKPDGERDIWVVSAGSDPVPFLITPFDERSPRFSPDGKWLAYVSDESGRDDVYVQPYPGPGAKWLVSTEGGTDPVWSRDGRELFYRQGEQLLTAAVSLKAAFSAGRPQRLFEIPADAGDNGPNYDVSPDGTWFVMPRRTRVARAGELHLVLNWFGEVAARSLAAGQ